MQLLTLTSGCQSDTFSYFSFSCLTSCDGAILCVSTEAPILTALQLADKSDLRVILVTTVAEEAGRNGEMVFSIADRSNLQSVA